MHYVHARQLHPLLCEKTSAASCSNLQCAEQSWFLVRLFLSLGGGLTPNWHGISLWWWSLIVTLQAEVEGQICRQRTWRNMVLSGSGPGVPYSLRYLLFPPLQVNAGDAAQMRPKK